MAKTRLIFLLLLIPLFRQDSYACATDLRHAPEASGPWVKYEAALKKHGNVQHPARKLSSSTDPNLLPTAQSPNPWGGTDSSKWRPEAILANAVSQALNDGWQLPGVDDVLVAVPLKMLYSDNRPYGDGQSNASPRFSDPARAPWKANVPPFVATWTTFLSAPPVLKLHFSQAFPDIRAAGSATLIYSINGERQPPKTLAVTKTPAGDFEATWRPSDDGVTLTWGDRFTNHVAFVQAPGRGDWLPLDFRDVVTKGTELLDEAVKAKIPASIAGFPAGGNLLDPVNLAPKEGETLTAYQKILAFSPMAFGNNTQWYPTVDGIHNTFANQITAVGNGSTWVLSPKPAPFKMAYICFDPRNEWAEDGLLNTIVNGVPSGGGWHEIGDPAETVFNTLESARVVFGYANGHPGGEAPAGGYFRGLTDVAVIRELKPGYALMTAAGPTTSSEGDWVTENWPRRATAGPEGRNYHWFIFNQQRAPLADGSLNRLCAVEWVHPCVPSAADPSGTACPR